MPLLLYKSSSPPGAGLETLVEQRLREGKSSSFLLVVPTNRKVRDAERRFLRLIPGSTAATLNLFTLETLAAELFGICLPPRRLLEGPSQAILLHQAVTNIAPSLQFFRPRHGGRILPNGTFRKILNVINRLKEEGLYPSLLRTELEGAEPGEQGKLRDVLAIVEEYERLLGDRFIDPAGYLKELNTAWDATVAERVRNRFQAADLIAVSGFDRFSDPELTLIGGLSGIAGFATVVSFDYHPGNPEIFGHLTENYRKLVEIGFRTAEADRFAESPFAEHIARSLFRFEPPENRPDEHARVTILDAAGRREEVRLVARTIKQLAKEYPGQDLGRICVAMYRPEPYTALFREIFAEYDIPANITDRYALDQSPVIIALMALLTVQERNFRLADLMRALTTPYFSFGTEEDRIDAGNLHDVAAGLRIRAGQSVWLRRIDLRLREVAERLAVADDDIELFQLARERKMLERARKDILRLTALLAPFAVPLDPQAFRTRVHALLDELHVAEGILSPGSTMVTDEQREKDARAYQKFLYFIDDYLEILGNQEDGAGAKPLSTYLEAMRTAIPQVRYNIRQQWSYGVQVTSLEETRGLTFDVMMIIGLVDGEFPPLYQPEVLFSRARREVNEQRHLIEHRYLFYQVAGNFVSHLYLTCPRREGNVQLMPSSFLDALAAVVAVDDRRGASAPAEPEPLCSVQELLHHAGMIQDGDLPEVLLPQSEEIREEVRGTVRHMRLASKVERSRQEGSGFPEYNGRIAGALSGDALKALQAFRERVYSVTQLESYGTCPFHFFAGKVLRLRVPPEVEEGITAADRGALLHEILFDFYVERRAKGQPPMADCTDEQFVSAIDRIREIARAKLDSIVTDDALWETEKHLYVGASERRGILSDFLHLERSQAYAVRPSYFELAFGTRAGGRKAMDPLLMVPEPLRAGEVRLRGKIDRLDTGGGAAKIIDYKTGAAQASRDELDIGMSLQLPIYLYAVEQLFTDGAKDRMIPAAGVTVRLRPPVREVIGLANREFRGTVFDDKSRSRGIVPGDAELRQIIGQAVAFANAYVGSIASGEFPVEPKKPSRSCRICDFKTICRIGTRLPLPEEDSDNGMEEPV